MGIARHQRKRKGIRRPDKKAVKAQKSFTNIAQASLNKWAAKICWLLIRNKNGHGARDVMRYFIRHCFNPTQILMTFELAETILEDNIQAGFDNYTKQAEIVTGFHSGANILADMRMDFCKVNDFLTKDGAPKAINIVEVARESIANCEH